MDTKGIKNLRFIGFLIGLLIFITALIVIFSSKSNKNVPNNKIKLSPVNENTKGTISNVPKLKSWPRTIITPIPAISDNMYVDSKKLENAIKENFNIIQNKITENQLHFTVKSAVDIKTNDSLSDSMIFDAVWPKEYRTELGKIENVMMQEGFINQSARNKMATDQDMFMFYRMILEVARAKHWVGDDQYANLLHGLTSVLPDVVGREKAVLQARKKASFPVPGGQRIAQKNNTTSEVVKDIIQGLVYVFSIAEPANAAWFRDFSILGGGCYKDDIPFYPVPGPNLWSFCCNCGMLCTPVGCTFLEDCGPEGVFCNVPLGCLNLACRVWPNAIWDPVTGICGCG